MYLGKSINLAGCNPVVVTSDMWPRTNESQQFSATRFFSHNPLIFYELSYCLKIKKTTSLNKELIFKLNNEVLL